MSARPMKAESITATDARFSFYGPNCDEREEVTVRLGDPAVRSAWTKGLAAPRARDRAWKANPECVECGKQIKSADQSGLLVQPDQTHRVAHRKPCFIRALVRINPTFSLVSTLRRTEGL